MSGGRNHTKRKVRFCGSRLRKHNTIKLVHDDRDSVYADDDDADADDERLMMNDD